MSETAIITAEALREALRRLRHKGLLTRRPPCVTGGALPRPPMPRRD